MFGHLLATDVDDVVEDKNQHAYHDGHTQSTLAYDGSQRCSDEEEDEAGQRECVFPVPFHMVLTECRVAVCLGHGPELVVILELAGAVAGIAPDFLPLCIGKSGHEGVEGLLCGNRGYYLGRVLAGRGQVAGHL